MRIHYIEVDTVQGIPAHSRPESYAVVRSDGGSYRLTREEPVGDVYKRQRISSSV